MRFTGAAIVRTTALGLLAAASVSCSVRGRVPRADSPELQGAAVLGTPTAPVTVDYYTDFRCGACRAFANDELTQIRRRFVDTGRMRLVARELSSGPSSIEDAIAARCAGEFGKYWVFHDSLFAATDSVITRDVRRRVAEHVGVPADPFARCTGSRRYAGAVHAERARADSLGIGPAPALLIGTAAYEDARSAARLVHLRAESVESVLRQ
jgi:protein-disulfide isomerase